MNPRDLARRSPLYRPFAAARFRWSTAAREQLFAGFYRDNIWGDPESRSGAGSSLTQTETLRASLPRMLRELGVRSLLDIPCGDFAWMQHVDLGDIDYIGADLVGEIVDDLNAHHAAPRRRFVRLDVIGDALPLVDAVMMRDLLQHLPNNLGVKALDNVKAARAKYLLASTYPSVAENRDVRYGAHRFPNLTIPPFSLPTPLHALAEQPNTPQDRADKTLAVWRVADL